MIILHLGACFILGVSLAYTINAIRDRDWQELGLSVASLVISAVTIWRTA